MKRLLLTSALCIVASPVWAQQATAVGVGQATSRSDSTAVAISGQGGQGGKGGTGIGIGQGGSVTIQGSPAVTTQNLVTSGTQTVKNVPSVFSPGLAAAGLETCLGSVSGGGSFVGTGFSFGSTIPDPGCAARLDARTLWAMGLKKAAIARLCLNPEINRSMPEVCGTYLPPAALPANYYLSAEGYRGGPIILTEGATGRDRLCNDYNEAKQRCRVWAGETLHVVRHAKHAVTPVASTPQVGFPTADNKEGVK